MKWVDVKQNEDEWERLRLGRVGASEIHMVMANYGKSFGDPAHRLALRVALERITGDKQESGYKNAAMDRGHEQEPIARKLYEDTFFCTVQNGGYFYNDDEGVSPDGLLYADGLVEIKSVEAWGQFSTLKRGSHDPKYTWQLCQALRGSQRHYDEYISYCSEFPRGKQLFVERVYAKDLTEKFDMISKRMDEFKWLVDEKTKRIRSIQL